MPLLLWLRNNPKVLVGLLVVLLFIAQASFFYTSGVNACEKANLEEDKEIVADLIEDSNEDSAENTKKRETVETDKSEVDDVIYQEIIKWLPGVCDTDPLNRVLNTAATEINSKL